MKYGNSPKLGPKATDQYDYKDFNCKKSTKYIKFVLNIPL